MSRSGAISATYTRSVPAIRLTLDSIPPGAEERLDRALAGSLPEHSRSMLARLIEQGAVRVNGDLVVRPSAKVRSGAAVEIELPEPAPSGAEPQEIPLELLYQDEAIAVIDKPPGLIVHPAAGHRDETLVNALLFHVSDLSGIGGELRPGIVHRLDRETSGVMVIAKNDAAHRRLAEAWGTPAVRKEYLALVYGTPKQTAGTIDKPIGRHPVDRKRMAIVAGGRRAVTLWEVAEHLRHLSLLRCRLQTGRTHQIRVHLKAIGHPIVGDPLYSGPQWRGIPDRKIQKLLSSFTRQALHAARLSFPHPLSGEQVTFEAPLPPDLATLLTALRS
jgi:23S rRNA pseudouridine1911/1915/1917 synthase